MSSVPLEKKILDESPDPSGGSSSSQEVIGADFSHAETYHEHGPPIDNLPHKAGRDNDFERHKKYLWPRIRHFMRDPFAEFMGTFTMIMFGHGSVAQVLLSANPKLPAGDQNKGQYQSISWGSVTSSERLGHID